MTKVLAFKIRSGEEVIAKVESTRTENVSIGSGLFKEKAVEWVLSKPHVLRVQQMNNGQLGLSFVPWCLSNPDIAGLILEDDAVLATFEPGSMVERQYLEQTSGISLATA